MISAGLLHKGRGETRYVTPFMASVCKWLQQWPTLTTKTKKATTETTTTTTTTTTTIATTTTIPTKTTTITKTTTTMSVYVPVDGYSSGKRLL